MQPAAASWDCAKLEGLEGLLLVLLDVLAEAAASDHQHAGHDDNGNRQAMTSQVK
jgi:hypothetical protein